MTLLVTVLFSVVLLDQALKSVIVHKLGSASVSLGFLGNLRQVQTQMWLVRASSRLTSIMIWLLWTAAALVLAMGHAWLASTTSTLSCGLLLGGSLSHLLETAARGSVCDYVCLHFWPAFNFADVAITAGAVGLALSMAAALA